MTTAKVKAVILRPDRFNDTIILKSGANEFDGKTFTHSTHQYFVDERSFQLTNGRDRWGGKEVYVTYYYKMGVPKPLPLADLDKIKTIGISSSELRALFTPWLYRQITPQEDTFWVKIVRIATFAAPVLLVYVIYMLSRLQTQLMDFIKAITG